VGYWKVNIHRKPEQNRHSSLEPVWRNANPPSIIICNLGAHHDPKSWHPSRMLQKRIDDQTTISRENMREAEGIFLQHLRRVGLKQTEQRNAILRTFLELASTCRSTSCIAWSEDRSAYRVHYCLSHSETPRRMRTGQRSRLPRRHCPLRTPVQPPQSSPHGLHDCGSPSSFSRKG